MQLKCRKHSWKKRNFYRSQGPKEPAQKPHSLQATCNFEIRSTHLEVGRWLLHWSHISCFCFSVRSIRSDTNPGAGGGKERLSPTGYRALAVLKVKYYFASNSTPSMSPFLDLPGQLLSRIHTHKEQEVGTEIPGSRWHFCPKNSVSREQNAMGKNRWGQSLGTALYGLQATVHPPLV